MKTTRPAMSPSRSASVVAAQPREWAMIASGALSETAAATVRRAQAKCGRRAIAARGAVARRVERHDAAAHGDERRDERRHLRAASFPAVREDDDRSLAPAPCADGGVLAGADVEPFRPLEQRLLARRRAEAARLHEEIGGDARRHPRGGAGEYAERSAHDGEPDLGRCFGHWDTSVRR